MAKFCTKCGKKLEEGEVCNCQETSEVLKMLLLLNLLHQQ